MPIFSDEAARAWLNGIEYHQDEEKAEIIAGIGQALTEQTTRALFAAHLSGRILAMRMLEEIVRGIVTTWDQKLAAENSSYPNS